jgi:hypothetical protein
LNCCIVLQDCTKFNTACARLVRRSGSSRQAASANLSVNAKLMTFKFE